MYFVKLFIALVTEVRQYVRSWKFPTYIPRTAADFKIKAGVYTDFKKHFSLNLLIF